MDCTQKHGYVHRYQHKLRYEHVSMCLCKMIRECASRYLSTMSYVYARMFHHMLTYGCECSHQNMTMDAHECMSQHNRIREYECNLVHKKKHEYEHKCRRHTLMCVFLHRYRHMLTYAYVRMCQQTQKHVFLRKYHQTLMYVRECILQYMWISLSRV